MDITKIVLLLKNAGLQNIMVGNGFIEFDDPACIYTAFDNILEVAWIIIAVLTAIMLFGWAVLYIKNGVKINTLFNNAKTIILIFGVLTVVKPAVNLIYGDNLFARGCDKKRVSLTHVQELMEIRNKTLSQSDEEELYEIFDVIDSGMIFDIDKQYMDDYDEPLDSDTLYGFGRGQFAGHQDNMNHSGTNKTDNNDVQYTSYTPNKNDSDNKANNTSSKKDEDIGFPGILKGDYVKATYAKGATIYINAKGERIKRSGGSVAWRNNNPGNIRKSKTAYELGAIGETDKWAVFSSEEEGMYAIVQLLRSDSYKNLSISGAIHRWAPSSDGNNPESYARKISKMTGLPANATINSLNTNELVQVAKAIKVIEGWIVGKEEKL